MRGRSFSPIHGRWPANVILTDPLFDGGVDGVVGGGPQSSPASYVRGVRPEHFDDVGEWGMKVPEMVNAYGDTGTYSRFFLIPKAARGDREPLVRGRLERVKGGVLMMNLTEPGEYDEFVHDSPEAIGAWLREQREAAGLQQKQVAAHFPSKTGGLTGCVANWELEFNRPTPEQWSKLREIIGFDGRYDEVMTATRKVDRKLMTETPRSVRANSHPTVKPVELMRHLVRLVTPPGGVVLDCFLGSGSTAIACEMEGFAWIGIEREPEYVRIAEARLVHVQRGLGL